MSYENVHYLSLQLYMSSLFYIFFLFYKIARCSGYRVSVNVSLNNIIVIKEDPLVAVTNVTPVAVGVSLSACVILFILVAVLVLR